MVFGALAGLMGGLFSTAGPPVVYHTFTGSTGVGRWLMREAADTVTRLTRGTGRAHVCRAALEAMCYQTRDVVAAMERESGIRLRELRADGGAAINGWLMQFQADILGVPVEVPRITETMALGAAFLAGLATGFWQSRAEIDATWKLARRYDPVAASPATDRLYARWQSAVARAREWALEEAEG